MLRFLLKTNVADSVAVMKTEKIRSGWISGTDINVPLWEIATLYSFRVPFSMIA
jgi:hypothetical protein